MFEQLEENPLGPFVVTGVGGVDFPVPVKGETERLELGFEAGHILPGDNLRVDVVLNGEVLSGQAKGVPPHGIQHVVPLQAAFARHDVQGGIGAGMAHV